METRKFRGRVYILVSAHEAKAGDVIDYLDEGLRTRRVSSSRKGGVTVEEITFGGVVVEGRRRVPTDAILRCWRRRTRG